MSLKTLALYLGVDVKDLNERMDGRVEWICEHGVGHTIYAPERMGKSGFSHGCDGCCRRLKNE